MRLSLRRKADNKVQELRKLRHPRIKLKNAQKSQTVKAAVKEASFSQRPI